MKKRLARLVDAGICSAEDVTDYAARLEGMAGVNAETAERQSRFFKALADATRLRILRLLEARDMCVCEVMVALGLTQPTASYHLGVLEGSGLVKERKRGKWVFYSLADRELFEALHKLRLL